MYLYPSVRGILYLNVPISFTLCADCSDVNLYAHYDALQAETMLGRAKIFELQQRQLGYLEKGVRLRKRQIGGN